MCASASWSAGRAIAHIADRLTAVEGRCTATADAAFVLGVLIGRPEAELAPGSSLAPSVTPRWIDAQLRSPTAQPAAQCVPYLSLWLSALCAKHDEGFRDRAVAHDVLSNDRWWLHFSERTPADDDPLRAMLAGRSVQTILQLFTIKVEAEGLLQQLRGLSEHSWSHDIDYTNYIVPILERLDRLCTSAEAVDDLWRCLCWPDAHDLPAPSLEAISQTLQARCEESRSEYPDYIALWLCGLFTQHDVALRPPCTRLPFFSEEGVCILHVPYNISWLTQVEAVELGGYLECYDFLRALPVLRSLSIDLSWAPARPQDTHDLLELVAQLTDLTQLSISIATGEDLSAPLWSSLRRLTALQTLKLEYCILGQVPDWLGELDSLQHLSLVGGGLSSLPSTLGRLTQLRQLDVEENTLREVPAVIRQLEHLEVLRLADNPLTDFAGFSQEVLVRHDFTLSTPGLIDAFCLRAERSREP